MKARLISYFVLIILAGGITAYSIVTRDFMGLVLGVGTMQICLGVTILESVLFFGEWLKVLSEAYLAQEENQEKFLGDLLKALSGDWTQKEKKGKK